MNFAIVSHSDTCLIISKYLILFNLGKTGSRHDDAAPLVFMNLIIWNVIGAVENDDAITVIIDVVVLDPAETSLDGEDSLTARLVN